MKLYNLTNHNQAQLAKLDLSQYDITEVEVKPRLRPAENPADLAELKEIVKNALNGLKPGDAVLVGGLGQFVALISGLPYRMFFANYDPFLKTTAGVIPFEAFTRQERFDIENQEVQHESKLF